MLRCVPRVAAGNLDPKRVQSRGPFSRVGRKYCAGNAQVHNDPRMKPREKQLQNTHDNDTRTGDVHLPLPASSDPPSELSPLADAPNKASIIGRCSTKTTTTVGSVTNTSQTVRPTPSKWTRWRMASWPTSPGASGLTKKQKAAYRIEDHPNKSTNILDQRCRRHSPKAIAGGMNAKPKHTIDHIPPTPNKASLINGMAPRPKPVARMLRTIAAIRCW